ncbi:single-stranded DNA-binding protein [Microbacterium sp. 2FI]|uniref:single-stranded DNA-binding protein n=1 Tax=Microbacterium sp. 2FI TaxID=2502193 RepID=UPI0010F86BDE|nr:single-stranded DNA-binding protein [Microbacterium sp. 2FI]
MSDTITITGVVGTDPQHKRTPNGTVVTEFRLASGQRRYDKAVGAWVDDGTNWYTVSSYRRLAEHAFHSLRKGERVIVAGRLRVRQWDNGTKSGTAVDIDADTIGHDLVWGTTRFEKDSPAGRGNADPADQPTDPPADDWAPALGADAVTEWPVVVPPAPSEGEIELALTGAESPF